MSECKSRHPFSTAMLLLLFVLETTCSIATGIGKKLAFSKDFSQFYTFFIFQNWSWMTTTSTDGPSLALFFYLWSLQLLENYWEVAFIVDVVERLAQVGYPWYFTISTQHSCKLHFLREIKKFGKSIGKVIVVCGKTKEIIPPSHSVKITEN